MSNIIYQPMNLLKFIKQLKLPISLKIKAITKTIKFNLMYFFLVYLDIFDLEIINRKYAYQLRKKILKMGEKADPLDDPQNRLR